MIEVTTHSFIKVKSYKIRYVNRFYIKIPKYFNFTLSKIVK
jgi:hypothetical protein